MSENFGGSGWDNLDLCRVYNSSIAGLDGNDDNDLHCIERYNGFRLEMLEDAASGAVRIVYYVDLEEHDNMIDDHNDNLDMVDLEGFRKGRRSSIASLHCAEHADSYNLSSYGVCLVALVEVNDLLRYGLCRVALVDDMDESDMAGFVEAW